MINRTIAMSRKLAKCNRTEQWFYFRLVPFADDYGRLPGDLFALKGMCFPHERLSENESLKFLNKLHEVGLVKFEEGKVVQFTAFLDNQKIGHKPANSLYPEYQAVTGIGLERSVKVGKNDDLCEPALSSIKLDSKNKKNVLDTTYRDIQGLILTNDENEKLLANYEQFEIDDVLDAMDNYNGLNKKYRSAYKTALNWLKRRKENEPKDF